MRRIIAPEATGSSASVPLYKTQPSLLRLRGRRRLRERTIEYAPFFPKMPPCVEPWAPSLSVQSCVGHYWSTHGWVALAVVLRSRFVTA
ncbi:hypothetical protein P154DRAFT_296454 [Amniculicola lignicola CBS 123094]|uniref:Uncharacterized protein n=1 Tax=Amniculicola lignicola CBS 123094 TaxID=1392246 RepID=A0A6A5W5X4_9PLEO|nr:hypothetical protein P154DRAFT_296454 [Amniculicola lignicola CBS 123094]